MSVQCMDEARVVAPERSMAQRMDALHRANEIRVWRAHRKLDLKAGRVSVTDLLLDVDERMATMKVFDLMLAMPKVGRVKANKLLVQCRISPSKAVGGMTERQRTELLSLLPRPSVRGVRRMG